MPCIGEGAGVYFARAEDYSLDFRVRHQWVIFGHVISLPTFCDDTLEVGTGRHIFERRDTGFVVEQVLGSQYHEGLRIGTAVP